MLNLDSLVALMLQYSLFNLQCQISLFFLFFFSQNIMIEDIQYNSRASMDMSSGGGEFHHNIQSLTFITTLCFLSCPQNAACWWLHYRIREVTPLCTRNNLLQFVNQIMRKVSNWQTHLFCPMLLNTMLFRSNTKAQLALMQIHAAEDTGDPAEAVLVAVSLSVCQPSVSRLRVFSEGMSHVQHV